jgi:hypothetical protein
MLRRIWGPEPWATDIEQLIRLKGWSVQPSLKEIES